MQSLRGFRVQSVQSLRCGLQPVQSLCGRMQPVQSVRGFRV